MVCVCVREEDRERVKKRFDEGDYAGGFIEEAPSAAPGLFKSSH